MIGEIITLAKRCQVENKKTCHTPTRETVWQTVLLYTSAGKCRKAVDDISPRPAGTRLRKLKRPCGVSWTRDTATSARQVAVPGLATYGAPARVKKEDAPTPANSRTRVWEPRPYVRTVPKLFEHLRKQLGDDVELLHDMHERVPPVLAIQLAKDLEQFRLFYLEDPLSPEDVGYFKNMRQQTSTPIAMGELFNNPNEWVPLISETPDRLHPDSHFAGGRADMARKVAAMCEFFYGPDGLAWAGGRVTGWPCCQRSPRSACPNFGIQEARDFTQAETIDVFPGCLEAEGRLLSR